MLISLPSLVKHASMNAKSQSAVLGLPLSSLSIALPAFLAAIASAHSRSSTSTPSLFLVFLTRSTPLPAPGLTSSVHTPFTPLMTIKPFKQVMDKLVGRRSASSRSGAAHEIETEPCGDDLPIGPGTSLTVRMALMLVVGGP